ncbi:MAG: penicillin-binding transpeptidase domain-containing protein, partial [Phyllobacterium sp.]
MIRSFLSRRQILAGGLLAVPALVEFKAKGWAKNTTDTSAPAPEIRPGLDVFFERAETAGAFVALRDGRLVANDEKRIGEGLLPASTFKVPHSIIALETGVVSDPDKDIFKWDGIPRGFPDWNKDHTLRSAIAASAVPVYQQIARRIGPERMQRYMDLIDYGNHSIGGGMDRFWLTGDLRVSPRQQVDFLDRLQRRALAVSERSQELALDILPVTK